MPTNTTDNETDGLCAEAEFILNTIELYWINIFQCIFGLLALFPNTLTLVLLWRVKVFHANLRLIMANLTCNLLIMSISTSIKALQRIVINPCHSPILLRICVLHDFTVLIPLHNALISLVILSLERLYATIRYRSYDYSKGTPFLAIFLISASWTFTLIQNIPNYFRAPPDLLIPVCETALGASRGVVARIMITNCTVESTAALIMLIVHMYNRYLYNTMAINKARYNLAARFQVIQNVKLNKALTPGFILHISCYLPSYILLILIFAIDNGLMINQKMWVLQSTLLCRVIYAVIDPVILITINPNFREAAKKTGVGKWILRIVGILRKNRNGKVDGMNRGRRNEMNEHFGYLEQAWDMNLRQERERRRVGLVDCCWNG